MFYTVRTARFVACPQKFEMTDDMNKCSSVRCGAWRFEAKAHKTIEVDGPGVEELFGFCGLGGVPTSKIRLRHQG